MNDAAFNGTKNTCLNIFLVFGQHDVILIQSMTWRADTKHCKRNSPHVLKDLTSCKDVLS